MVGPWRSGMGNNIDTPMGPTTVLEAPDMQILKFCLDLWLIHIYVAVSSIPVPIQNTKLEIEIQLCRLKYNAPAMLFHQIQQFQLKYFFCSIV